MQAASREIVFVASVAVAINQERPQYGTRKPPMPGSGRRKSNGTKGECGGKATAPNHCSVDKRTNYRVAKESRVTVCLVHGTPETAAVWDRLAPLLDHGPVVRLSPPGFGAPVPPRFTATAEEYRGWLVSRV